MVGSTNPRIMADNIRKLEGKIKANDVVANPTGDTTADLTKIEIDGVKYSIIGEAMAKYVSYDNTDSGLTADDVQAAIDELAPALTSFIKGSLTNIDHLVVTDNENAITFECYTGTDDENGYYIMFTKAGKQLRLYSVTNSTPTLLWNIQGT